MLPVPLLTGFPKSGNHALCRAVELLGVPGLVSHLPYSDGLIKRHEYIILIKRDPRDVIVSWLRMQKKPVTAGTFVAAFRRFQTRSLIEEMADFEPWLDHGDVYLVRYEDLIRDARITFGLAAYLGVPYLEDAFPNLLGFTRTWNAERSDYRKVWSDAVEAVWNAEGGPELLSRWGY